MMTETESDEELSRMDQARDENVRSIHEAEEDKRKGAWDLRYTVYVMLLPTVCYVTVMIVIFVSSLCHSLLILIFTTSPWQTTLFLYRGMFSPTDNSSHEFVLLVGQAD